jgi:cytochrome c-type biogenesis protein CcmE
MQKNKKFERAGIIFVSLVLMIIGLAIILKVFNDNIVFFYSPTDLYSKKINTQRIIKIGGLVKANSMVKNYYSSIVTFVVTDGNKEIIVEYKGMLPNLFKEGQGVVATGVVKEGNKFQATEILAKHDENYMPKEVVDSLKKSGRWKE